MSADARVLEMVVNSDAEHSILISSHPPAGWPLVSRVNGTNLLIQHHEAGGRCFNSVYGSSRSQAGPGYDKGWDVSRARGATQLLADRLMLES